MKKINEYEQHNKPREVLEKKGPNALEDYQLMAILFAKYARIHKLLIKKDGLSNKQAQILDALSKVKQDSDEKVLNNSNILQNESYLKGEMLPLIIQRFKIEQKIKLN